jgi:N-acetylmuramoyl-L-alanine amidase
MSELANIKRRVIGEAVRENLDVMTGVYRMKRMPIDRRVRNASRVVFLVTLPVALFFAAFLASKVADGWIQLQSAKLTERVVTEARAGEGSRFASPDAAVSDFDRPPSSGSDTSPGSDTSSLTDNLAAASALDRSVFPLGVRKIIVDPGHGGKNTGTISPSGLVEKTIALDIAERLSELLKKADFEVAMTRSGDTFLSLEERAEVANTGEGDLFISVHLNWIETKEVRGIETYYLGPTDDPYLTQLAAAENQDSGYSLANFRKMLDRVFADVRQDESKKLAGSVQRSLYNSLRRVNPTLQDRGVKKAPFIVLTGTEMPAILAEVSCLSNEKEARLLMTPEYRQFIAEALSRGIEGYARELNKTSLRGS